MSPLRLFTLLALVLAGLASCDASPLAGPTAPGTMRLAITPPPAAPADITRVTVTVSGPDLVPLSTDLSLTDGTWGGVLGDIPAGSGRTFRARAFTDSSVPRYEGRADNVTVLAGVTGLVSLLLQEVSPPPPSSNEAPRVDALVATPTSVAPGGTVSLSATAHDPNAGDTLSYAWSAPSGAFAAPTQASTAWTAPTTEGPVTLSLSVSDSRGAALTVGLTVVVSVGGGAQEVKVDFNTAPRVVALTSSQPTLDVGQPTELSATASDADGDALSYQWSATCEGTFTGTTSASTTFTPSALPTAACNNCQLRLTVKDGRGGQNTGSVALCVARDTTPRGPPTLTRTYQSSATAKGGQQLSFELEASDPAGLALTFAWTATVGTLGTASSDATQSRITWTAPACLYPGPTASLTATVTNARGQTTPQVFPVTGPATCPRWALTGSMSTPRAWHTATRLAQGRVLVVGGSSGSGYPLTSELYDPATGTWSPTGALRTAQSQHTATLLADGRVLIAGGTTGTSLATAQVYDPATGTWSATGSMTTARQGHGAALLPNGKVLVTGGFNDTQYLATAELYDPATGTWSATGSLSTLYRSQVAMRLTTGQVLVVGELFRDEPARAELYDPATGTWTLTASPVFKRPGKAVLLNNGAVLISNESSTPEFYQPVSLWSFTGRLSIARPSSSLTLLSTGRVLATGGYNLLSAEVYDPVTYKWSFAGDISAVRSNHTATLLSTGRVLITGGHSSSGIVATAELYDPDAGP